MAGSRLAWAVSGSGTTLQAVVKAGKQNLLTSRVVLVVADRELPIQAFCHGEGIRFRTIIPQVDAPHSTFQNSLRRELLESAVDWLFLTFNRLIDASSINILDGRAINLHMSLLPEFPGFGAIRKALAAGVDTTGVTIHQIDEGVDTGPILAQATCPVLDGDTEATLGRRQFEVSLPVVLQVIRSIERDELYLDELRHPIWRNRSRKINGRGNQLAIDPDLINFSGEFCGTQPTPKRYSAGRINLAASDPTQNSKSSTDTKPSKSP